VLWCRGVEETGFRIKSGMTKKEAEMAELGVSAGLWNIPKFFVEGKILIEN
jgi:hypothetical protein